MKTFREFMKGSVVQEKTYTPIDDNAAINAEINEGFISGAIVTARLNSLKNQVLNEDDPKKQNDILAKMIHFGIGTIALVTNDRRRRK